MHHSLYLWIALQFVFGSISNSYEQKLESPALSSTALLNDEGLILLEKHCYACHNPRSTSHEQIIAPPLYGVKKHYLEKFPEKREFTEAMKSFITNPTEEKALMKGPIKRFGLMPKPVVSDADLSKIITYLYESEIENPVWHIEKDNEEMKGKKGSGVTKITIH